MGDEKICVGILFGGRSPEHEISVISARNIFEAIDKDKYKVLLIGISKDGDWYLGKDTEKIFDIFQEEKFNPEGITDIFPGFKRKSVYSIDGEFVSKIDVAFPITHGTFGEDGCLQGLLKLSDIPFIGASVLGSAVGMDKEILKRLLDLEKISNAKYLTYYYDEYEKIDFDYVKDKLGLPLFIKPVNLGSSVGINKVSTREEFDEGIKEALSYDTKILIEEFIDGREVECAVLGERSPVCSVLGEVIPHNEDGFYSYKAKYLDDKGADLIIPAKFSEDMEKKIKKVAVKTFKTMQCEGLARVDFFIRGEEIFINEVNTLPGFTKISMYPKLFGEAGISYSDLIDKLIEFAFIRYKREEKLRLSFSIGE